MALATCTPQPAAPPDPLADLTDPQRRQVGQRLTLVQAYERMVRDFKSANRTTQEACEVFLLGHPDVTRTTLYRWQADYRREGVAGLVDRRASGQRSAVSGQLSASPCPRVSASSSIGSAAWQRFKDLWLTLRQRPVSLCYQIVAAERIEGDPDWSWPGLRAVQLAAQAIPATQRDWYRLGDKEWRRRHSPHVHRDYEAVRPGELWCADFHQWDVFCRRSETDPTIVRPSLSAWLDLRSRMLVGWDIGERETSDAVLLAFRNGVEAMGPPQQVVIDNGKPYRAQGVSGGRPSTKRKIKDEAYVRSVFGGLGILCHFAIPYNPDSKPVEGWFAYLEMDFGKTFASYCSGDLKSECFRQAHKLSVEHPEECPTVDQLRDLFGQWLQAHHMKPHSAADLRGLSPAQAYEQLDPIPRAIVPDGDLDVLLMRTTKSVKISKWGVVYNGIEYGMTDPRVQKMHGQEVCLRIDPIDASYVIICDLQGHPLLRAVNNTLALHEISQDKVAAGQISIKRAKRLARSVRDGDMKPAMQSVTQAAIAAKVRGATAQQAMQQLMRATGADDVGSAPADHARNLTPMRSDYIDAMQAFNRGSVSQISNLESEIPGPTSLADLETEDTETRRHGDTESPLSLADLDPDMDVVNLEAFP